MILAIILVILTIPLIFSRGGEQCIFPKNGSLRIRGLLALLIVFHHCSYFLHINWYSILFEDIGMWICGMFFMQSGYGLYTNRLKYRKMSFLLYFRKRIKALLCDYVIISCIYVMCTILTHRFQVHSLLSGLLHGNTTQILPYSWFIIELIMLYLFSFLSFKTRITITLTIIASFLLMVGMYKLGFGCEWWMSTMAYPLGMIVKRLEAVSIYNKYHKIVALSIALITIGLSVVNVLYDNIFVWLVNILFVAYTLNYQMARINIPFKILDYFASISNYIYMFQGFAIVLIMPLIATNGLAYLLITLFITISLAISYNTIKNRLSNV